LDGEDHLQFLRGNGCVSFAQSSPNGGRKSGFVTRKTITINTSKTETGMGMIRWRECPCFLDFKKQ